MKHTGRSVAEFVADFYGLSMEDFRSDCRQRHIARPRQVAMFMMRELCPHLSLPSIGKMLGSRDHTTIIHGVRQIEAVQESDSEVAACIKAVRANFPITPTFGSAFEALEWARDLPVAA